MQYLKLFPLTLISFLIFSFSSTAEAFNPNKLPVSQKSEQWNVQIGESKMKNNSFDSKKGVYDSYSLDVKNIGKEAYNVTVEVYRNEPKVQKKYELFTMKKDHIINGTESINCFQHTNFPISVKSKELEVLVTWQEKPYTVLKDGKQIEARKYKETFIFKDK
ncbi:hypothetical protein COI93_17905 [Bacillus cereus]|uniref:Group-specific protein n=1 Tax=Bacillus cereus TaxID=1396 RepID=A0A2B0LWA9_BACCE|nr:hypothetical protein COI93_17905 [Bacillus cereus]